MPSFNRVTLMGNLTRDPQLKQLPSNTTVAEFGMAMSRRYKTQTGEDREEVAFVDCSAFGKQAEVIGQYCRKGKPLFVEGRLKFDQWDDKTSGSRRNKLSVVVENFQFVGGRDEAAGGPAGSGFGAQKTFDDPDQRARPERPAGKGQQPGPRATARTAKAARAAEHFTEEDIPF